MGGSRASSPLVVTSSDDEEAVPVVSPPPVDAAVLPESDDAEYEYEWPGDEDVPRPDWLPDGFYMETKFICPVTRFIFGTKNEVLDYCSSGALQRAIEAKNTLDDKTTLQGKYAWLRGDHKWLLEIRAGGENGRKMFKVYAHPSSKVRITSKAEVMRLINEGKLPDESSNDEDCDDTSNKENIIAQLDFNIASLPPGWVKETAYRKCRDGGIRTDKYYTDPVTKKVFSSLKSAEQYFKYEKIMDCFKPRMSVTDLYSFDGCIDMPPCLAIRQKMGGTKDQYEEEGQTSYCRTLTIEVGEDGKEVLHGDSKEKHDEEECHGDDKKEDKEETPCGDGKEDKDELGPPHGNDKVSVNGEEMPCGDGLEDDEDQLHGKRSRLLTELYSVPIKKGNSERKGKKKN